MPGSVSAAGITFDGTGYTLGGSGTISLTNAAIITVNQSATINSVLSGTGGMTVNGSALLILGGSNVYTGGTTMAAAPCRPTSPRPSRAAYRSVPGRTDAPQLRLQLFQYDHGHGYLKVLFNSTTTTNDYFSGVTGFSGTMELANNGANGDKWNCGINPPDLTLIIDPEANSKRRHFKGISLSGTGNLEGRGAIRLNGTVSTPLTLLGNTTIGAEAEHRRKHHERGRPARRRSRWAAQATTPATSP